MTDTELVQAVVREVAALTGNDPIDLFNKDKRMQITQARGIVFWILRAAGGMSFPVLGKQFGCHHTAVMYLHTKTCNAIRGDASWRFWVGDDRTWINVKSVADKVMAGLNRENLACNANPS